MIVAEYQTERTREGKEIHQVDVMRQEGQTQREKALRHSCRLLDVVGMDDTPELTLTVLHTTASFVRAVCHQLASQRRSLHL